MEGAKVRGELGCVKGKMLGVREMMRMGHAVEQVWRVSPDVFHGPRRLFKRKPAPADNCEQYWATAVLRSLGSKSTFEGPTGDY